MSDFYIDINEIIALIGCVEYGGSREERVDLSVKAFTKTVGDDYLDDRASTILDYMTRNEKLKQAFEKLDGWCPGKPSSVCEQCVVRNYCNSYIESARKNYQNRPAIVDLFCGAGGLSLGFVQEGFRVALANDIEACCIDTYAHNHPEVPRNKIVHGDIRNVIADLERLIGEQCIDLIVGGPPCQGFSMANRQRLIDDPRNYLYKNYIEMVKRIQPRFFVMENVKGMLGVSSQVKEDFEAIGYEVSCRVLNAKDFGVPQNRERLIYIGNRVGVDNDEIFDKIMQLSSTMPRFVLDDALYGLRPLEALRVRNATELDSEESGRKIEGAGNYEMTPYIRLINCGRTVPITANHKARYNNERDIEIYSRMNPGDRSDDPKIADIMPYANRNDIFKDKYFKLEPDKICKTITAHMKFDCNMYIHPTQARGLTPREAARVQSYPDDYYFRGSYTKTYMQIGNSVPPLLGRVIAAVIKQYL